jgi:choline kinase
MIQTAILLAAGAGTRFWPYNVVRNKCAKKKKKEMKKNEKK